MSEILSATRMTGAFRFAVTLRGKIDASTMCRSPGDCFVALLVEMRPFVFVSGGARLPPRES